ncbi:hypothetical protein JL720_416 [Aureococcus anophagefferens]|nr:hypothetical protein JL720_416 [Aureococcus anophagefferens]
MSTLSVAEACAVLGFDPSAGLPADDELRKAFRREALKHHPDKNPGDEAGAAERFQRVKEASEVLVKARDGGGSDGAAAADDDEDAFAAFFGSSDADEVLAELLVRMYEQENRSSMSARQLKRSKEFIKKMRARERMAQLGEARRARGRAREEGGRGAGVLGPAARRGRAFFARRRRRLLPGLGPARAGARAREAQAAAAEEADGDDARDAAAGRRREAVPERRLDGARARGRRRRAGARGRAGGWQAPAASTGQRIDAGIRKRKAAKKEQQAREDAEQLARYKRYGAGAIACFVVLTFPTVPFVFACVAVCLAHAYGRDVAPLAVEALAAVAGADAAERHKRHAAGALVRAAE